MRPQHSAPDSVDKIVASWRVLANSADPLERATGKHLLQEWQRTRAVDEPREQDEDRPPARWAHALAELIARDEPQEQRWSDQSHFKTGHSLMHGSKSGTCLSVNTERGVWYCSSCRRGGDAIGWLVVHFGQSRDQAWWSLRRAYGDPHGR